MINDKPDENCISLEDGSCVGKKCMHDIPEQNKEAQATFTDKDFKRLKKDIQRHRDRCTCLYHPILARLEAAEKLITCEDLDIGDNKEVEAAYQAWRKAAGK